ncbi:Lon protease C-terminal proteolytic domain-domain-containing protein [Kockovaella imperatae]|uniref:endopeptidase La n=1 Tax=Kockovaella imperatae TaxID=4999 RepID=A0A1Y1UJ15_9TREE|nr:Lon protease C-terminal proteolytic domain-domain-containing protein [Kockovaella imperatae]ORX37547.1 Lon protease C-terminal proteolytic domain-domain-containing protein [Kockovaella imperatae]
MSSSPFLPSTLPLLPLPPPQVLYPNLQVSVPLPSAQLALVLNSIADNAKTQKAEDSGRMIAVVPVVEIERRVGRWACAARVKRIERSTKDQDTFHLILEGLARIRLPRSLPPVLSILPPIPLHISTFSLPLSLASPNHTDLLPLAKALLPPQLHDRMEGIPPSLLSDLLVSVLSVDWEKRVELLGVPDVETRCVKVKEILMDHLADKGGLTPSKKLEQSRSVPSTSTALIRRPPQARSSPRSPLPEDLQLLQNTLDRRFDEISPSALSAINRELERLTKIPPQSAEYGVGRTYVEWLLSLPWKKVSEIDDKLDLKVARDRLDEEHEGLQAVKRRVVEYLAVYRLKKQLFLQDLAARKEASPGPHASTIVSEEPIDARGIIGPAPAKPSSQAMDQEDPPKDIYRDKGPILLLVGPPGVGKTSIARSLAESLGRKFHRISLGGVRDEAEIRGHRRTYVGALPGLLVQGLRKVGTSNPLILLDELDKVGSSSFHGDPSAALLETLDPAQNWSFHDHYLGDVPIDLSQVLFIATANTLETISAPLLDRCEVIECSGYVVEEKLKIAKRFLLPKQARENGLDKEKVVVDDQVMLKIVTDYTREAGVRSLEREIGKVCRWKAVQWSAARDNGEQSMFHPTVSLSDLEDILGLAKFDIEVREEQHRPGVVNGLAYQGSGIGGILLIESTLVPGGKGRLVTTGSLGDVISESAELALTWVRSRANDLGITSDIDADPLRGVDIHIHLPAGAVKKDGPSAGVGMVLAMVSLLSGRSIPSTVAVTGEITLRGAVTAVGGIKEKVLGAHRAGITKIILPKRNLKDVQSDLPESVREEMSFAFVSTIPEVLAEIWGEEVVKKGSFKVEARL